MFIFPLFTVRFIHRLRINCASPFSNVISQNSIGVPASVRPPFTCTPAQHIPYRLTITSRQLRALPGKCHDSMAFTREVLFPTTRESSKLSCEAPWLSTTVCDQVRGCEGVTRRLQHTPAAAGVTLNSTRCLTFRSIRLPGAVSPSNLFKVTKPKRNCCYE
ncbi:hypothetical protein E2C01_049565 [Portunus trituberculatus]|uniref:Uncharacterized protein n=1 Tax=Portunus trituberculatus TaxID=210409 RepID=A0A5B7GEA0_PORTR|nr:hypothetical protein [Portunus trituberculatus]